MGTRCASTGLLGVRPFLDMQFCCLLCLSGLVLSRGTLIGPSKDMLLPDADDTLEADEFHGEKVATERHAY